MKFLKSKNSLKKRKFFFQNEIKKSIICSIKIKTMHLYISNLITYYFVNLLFTKKVTSKIRNECIITGYSRFVYKKLRMSRFQIKRLTKLGYIFGCKPSTW